MVFRAATASLASPNKGAFPRREVSSGGREPPSLSSCRRVCVSVCLGSVHPSTTAPVHPIQAIPTLSHPHSSPRTCKGRRRSPEASPAAGQGSPRQEAISGCQDLATPSPRAVGVAERVPGPGSSGQTIPCLATFLPRLPGAAQAPRC